LRPKHDPLPPIEIDSGTSIEMIYVSIICTGRISAIALFSALILNDIDSTTATLTLASAVVSSLKQAIPTHL
jgi:hypothetical protein